MSEKSDEAASASPAIEELADEAPPEIPDIDSGSVALGRIAPSRPASAPPPPSIESTPPHSRRLAPPPKPRGKAGSISGTTPPPAPEGAKPDELARFDMPSQVSLRAPVAPAIAYAPDRVAAPPRPRPETEPPIPRQRTESEPIVPSSQPREPDNVIVPPRPEPPSAPRRPRLESSPGPEASVAQSSPQIREMAPPLRTDGPRGEMITEPMIQGLSPDRDSIPIPISVGGFSAEEPPSFVKPESVVPRPKVPEMLPPALISPANGRLEMERESAPPVLPDFEVDPPTPRLPSRPGPAAKAMAGLANETPSVEPAPLSAPEPVTEPRPSVGVSAGAPSSPLPPRPKLTVPEDVVPATPPPQPAVSIAAMRIIAVGAPAREVPPEITVDLDFEEVLTERLTQPEAPRVAEEPAALAEVEVTPDSDKLAEKLDIEELVSEPALPAAAEIAKKEEAKPPPPPPRRGARPGSAAPPQSKPKQEQPERGKQRHPWWEDLFNEDFMRANFRLTDEQIRREVTFIEHSLGVAPGGVVLDLGCGAGHHAVEFASRGYGVVGYDLSLYQLALAADVAQERNQKINFLQGDMREMAFEEMFDGVFCWNTTFGYFEEEKNFAVAQRVFKALRPGGTFLLDVINRDFAARTAPSQIWFEGDSCVCMDDMSVDYITSRLRVKRSLILDDGRTKEATYSVRLYSMHELGKLLHEVGFRVTEASGHPSMPGVFFGPHSPRIIMLAQRP